jgi:hypothetical protein
MDRPSFGSALRNLATNVEEALDLLTTRLEQRTAALSRVVQERDKYREALVAVLSLEPTHWEAEGDEPPPFHAVEAVHDAIGGDLIMALMYRQRVILPAPSEELPADWSEVMKGRFVTLPDEGMKIGPARGPGEPDYSRVRELMEQHGRSWEQAFRIALDVEEGGGTGIAVDWRDPIPKPMSMTEAAEAIGKFARFEPHTIGVEMPNRLRDSDLKPYLDARDQAITELADLYAGPRVTHVVVDGWTKTAEMCRCTWNADTIQELEASCPVHGHPRCPTCHSGDAQRRQCASCKEHGKCDLPVFCTDRWHER